MNSTFYSRHGKRWLDAALAFAGLVILSPLLLFSAIAVWISSSGPALFRQIRTGQKGTEFYILKFRSMQSAPGGNAPLITASGDSRITPIGRWLRKTKIDELPQLMNVLWGEMSFVGPRPEVPKYTSLYTDRQRQTLSAKPGITGPAAIAFVDEELILSLQEEKESYYVKTLLPAKLELDIAYCQRISLRGDSRLILKTLSMLVARREGRARSLENIARKGHQAA